MSENTEIQEKIKKAQDAGVHVTACKACADQLGVTETLEKLNYQGSHRRRHAQTGPAPDFQKPFE